jgi:hypothetical protein
LTVLNDYIEECEKSWMEYCSKVVHTYNQ